LKTLGFVFNLKKLIENNCYRTERRNAQIFTIDKLNQIIGKLGESYNQSSATYLNRNYQTESENRNENENQSENFQWQIDSGNDKSENESDDSSRYFERNAATKQSTGALKSKTSQDFVNTKRSRRGIRRVGRFFDSAKQFGLNSQKNSKKLLNKKIRSERRNGKLFSEIEIEKLKNLINNFEENHIKLYENL